MEKCENSHIEIAELRKEKVPEMVEEIALDLITDFQNHPFKIRDDEEMKKMVESVKENGVLNPILVRPKENGMYEIISGHRRKRASEIVRNKSIPAIVRNLTDDEAIIIMVDSNLQREEILPSEKAFAYKMKLEAMNRQGCRSDLTSDPMGQKLDGKTTRQIVSEQIGESSTNIQRYIRLTELIPEILQMVDKKQVAFRPAVEISYLTKTEQKDLYELMQYADATPSLAQAIRLKKLSYNKTLDADKIEEIINEDKPNQVLKLKISQSKLEGLLPSNVKTDAEAEEFIIKCLKEYNQRQKRKEKNR